MKKSNFKPPSEFSIIKRNILSLSLIFILLFTSCSPSAKNSVTSLKQRWNFKAQSWFLSAPAVGKDGTLYVGSWDGNLYAIDKNGKLKWRYKTGDHILCSPAIGEGETIYFSSGLTFYSIDSGGKLNWKISLEKRKNFSLMPLFACSSPYKVNDNTLAVNVLFIEPLAVFSRSINEINVKTKTVSIIDYEYVFDMLFDTLHYTNFVHAGLISNAVWKRKSNSDWEEEWSFDTVLPMTYIKPIANGDLVVASFNNIYKINSSGKLIWEKKTLFPITLITPLEDGTVYFVSFNSLYKVDKNGKIVWKIRNFLPITQLSISKNGDVYFASLSSLYKLNSSGKELSRFKAFLPITSMIPSNDGIVYVTSLDHSIYALYESP